MLYLCAQVHIAWFDREYIYIYKVNVIYIRLFLTIVLIFRCYRCCCCCYYLLKHLNAPKEFSLREKCPYSEFFWSTFSRLQTEYGEMRSISPYSVRMRENMDQKNSEYEHFSRSVCQPFSSHHPLLIHLENVKNPLVF